MTIEEARDVLCYFLPAGRAFSVDQVAWRRSSGQKDTTYKVYIQDGKPRSFTADGTDLQKVLLQALGNLANSE